MQHDAPFRELGLELVDVEHRRRERRGHADIVEQAAVERQHPRLRFLQIAMSTVPVSGSLRPVRPFAIAASPGSRPGGGYVSLRKSGFASSTIRCPRVHDFSRYGPVPTGFSITRCDVVLVLVDDFARDSREARRRQPPFEAEVRLLEADAQRVAVDRLQAFDLLVVIELAGFACALERAFEPDQRCSKMYSQYERTFGSNMRLMLYT